MGLLLLLLMYSRVFVYHCITDFATFPRARARAHYALFSEKFASDVGQLRAV